jgi:hypothetical protein
MSWWPGFPAIYRAIALAEMEARRRNWKRTAPGR